MENPIEFESESEETKIPTTAEKSIQRADELESELKMLKAAVMKLKIEKELLVEHTLKLENILDEFALQKEQNA